MDSHSKRAFFNHSGSERFAIFILSFPRNTKIETGEMNLPEFGRASPTTEVIRIFDQKPILAPMVTMFESRSIVAEPLASASPRMR